MTGFVLYRNEFVKLKSRRSALIVFALFCFNSVSKQRMQHMQQYHCSTAKPDLIGKGFRKAGIFPWNPAGPNMERTGPSQVYAQESSTAAVPGQVTGQSEDVTSDMSVRLWDCFTV